MLAIMVTLDHHAACLQNDLDRILPMTLPAALAGLLPWSAALTVPCTAPAPYPAVAVTGAADHTIPTASICTKRHLHCTQVLQPKRDHQPGLPAASLLLSLHLQSAHDPVRQLLLGA